MKTQLLLSLLFITNILFAQRAGDLDATFNGGKVTVDKAQTEAIGSMMIQPDGKILAAGFAGESQSLDHEESKLILMRFNPNGSLDAGFGAAGVVNTGFKFINFDVHSFALQHDGKIMLAGVERSDRLDPDTYTEINDMYIMRYNSNGTVDPTFNKVVVSDTGSLENAFVMIQSDGDIAVVGTMKTAAEGEFHSSLFMVQCDREGKIENRNALPTEGHGVGSIALQPDDKVVVMLNGFGDYALALARLNGDCSTDNTFGTEGMLPFVSYDDDGMSAATIALQDDGKIVLTGTIGLFGYSNKEESNIVLMRFNSDGRLDASFGESGKQSTVIDSTSLALAVLIQPDGKILVAGGSGSSQYEVDFFLTRYTAEGFPDNSFGVGGVVTTNFQPMDVAFAMAQQQDGKIILAGGSGEERKNDDKENIDIALARYISESGTKQANATVAGNLTITGNPVKGEQVLQYIMEQDGNVTIELYDVSGRLVMTVASNEPRSAGVHNETVRFDESLPSGRYLLTMTTTQESKSVWVVKQ